MKTQQKLQQKGEQFIFNYLYKQVDNTYGQFQNSIDLEKNV